MHSVPAGPIRKWPARECGTSPLLWESLSNNSRKKQCHAFLWARWSIRRKSRISYIFLLRKPVTRSPVRQSASAEAQHNETILAHNYTHHRFQYSYGIGAIAFNRSAAKRHNIGPERRCRTAGNSYVALQYKRRSAIDTFR